MEPNEAGGGVAVIDDPEAGASPADAAGEVRAETEAAFPDAAGDEADRLREYDAETLRLIGDWDAEEAEAEARHLTLKAQAAEAKKIYEGMVAEHRQMRRHRFASRGKPPEKTLFTGVGADDRVPGDGCLAAGDADPLENLWQEYPLARWTAFGLTEKQLDKLGSAGVSTVGDLAAYTRPNDSGYCKRLTDIAGVGKGTAEKVEEASGLFFAEWNRVLREKFAEERGVSPRKEEAGGGPERDAAEPGGDAPAPDAVVEHGPDA